MQRIYHRLLKEVNGNHKYLRFPYLLDNNFEVLLSDITMDKVDLVCAETVKTKSIVNDSDFVHTRTQFILMLYG